jgi:hypothetical protein
MRRAVTRTNTDRENAAYLVFMNLVLVYLIDTLLCDCGDR